MSNLIQKVVVIQDASEDSSLSALNWALTGFELRPGDELILLSVLRQVTSPLGCKIKADSSSIFGASNKVIKKALHKKKYEYENSVELIRVHDMYEASKVEFSVLVMPAASLKRVVMEAAKMLKATWIILDRRLKKDRKYFLRMLTCGIARIKSDGSIELLRWSKSPTQIRTAKREGINGSRNVVTYDHEMVRRIPNDSNTPENVKSEEPKADGQEKAVQSTRIPSSPASNFCSIFSAIYWKDVYETSSTPVERSPLQASGKEEVTTNGSSNAILSYETTVNRMKNIEGAHLTDDPEVLKKSICSECGNERPKMERMMEFTYGELYHATEKFSSRNFLAQGGFGPVFKGKLGNGAMIAVKQHGHGSLQGEKEFRREVRALSKARHETLVMLLGFCAEGNHRLLVYEYVCNKSLDHHLSDDNPRVLSWKDRLKIALGAAKGLQYLHSLDIIHRDMRPSNILVTHDYRPMLGDFGLARTQEDGSEGSSGTRVVGTVGYVAPEYAESGTVTKKSDVYSFAVVLLELISGRRTLDKSLQETSLVGWARPLLKDGKYQELIDPRIMDSHDVHQLFGMVQIIEHCMSRDPEKRPTMDEVVKYGLNCVIEGLCVTCRN